MAILKFKVRQRLGSLKPSTTRLLKRKAIEADLAELEIKSDFVLKSGSAGHIQNPKESNAVVDSLDDQDFN